MFAAASTDVLSQSALPVIAVADAVVIATGECITGLSPWGETDAFFSEVVTSGLAHL